jgi:GTPase involved in cell partitioning and DNA repair
VRSGPGEARTILLLHIISVRPSKQPLMVRTFLKVYLELGSYFLFLQEQIKDIIIIEKISTTSKKISRIS